MGLFLYDDSKRKDAVFQQIAQNAKPPGILF